MASASGAEWLSAVSTFLAMVAAVFAGWVAHRAHTTAAEERERAEAEGIQAWLASEDGTKATKLVLVNAGSRHVYDLSVGVSVHGEDRRAPSAAGVWKVLPPGTYESEQPGRRGWKFPKLVGDLTSLSPYTMTDKYLVQWLEFTDTRGRRWRRGVDGSLTKIRPHKPVVAEEA